MKLSKTEKQRLLSALNAACAIPFIDDIEDFIWEAVFAYSKGIQISDPFTETRSKKLFDVVDLKKGIGWSAKALQTTKQVEPLIEFELVIQRADIFKKAKELGFDKLTTKTPTNIIGKALLKHWCKKIIEDSSIQKVLDKRICILLKSDDRKTFAYYEEKLELYSADDLVWKWTDETRTGLRGIRKSDKFCVFRWYPNQKQLFERFVLPEDAFIFELNPARIQTGEFIRMLEKHLAGKTP